MNTKTEIKKYLTDEEGNTTWILQKKKEDH